jgi:tetratricopeptide (TPR) repeat protein
MKTQIFAFVFLLFLIACKQSTPTEQTSDKLGQIEIQVTGSDEAIPHFEKGLLLLHSFEYEDAAVEFKQARTIDPDMVMAYWGEAMTHNHPLWSRVNIDEARGILNELAETKEARKSKAKTDLEKDFLEAVELLFGDGEKLERDDAYALQLGKMHKSYPENNEVSAFYALSLLGSVDEGRDVEVYAKGAEIAQQILDKNPEHPGALHYLIHSYDDPDHAHKAVYAADNYSKVAPDAGHALHMPSHIYIAMGNWDDVISSNVASFEASKVRKQEKDLSNEALGYHAFQWLMYGYLQKGDLDNATRVVKEMEQYSEGLKSPRARSYRAMMEANYRTDTENWAADAVSLATNVDDLNISMQAVQSYVDAMVSYHNGDMEIVQSEFDSLSFKRKKAQDKVLQRGVSMCSNVGWYQQLPTQVEVNHAHVIEMEIAAFLEMKKGNDLAVEELLKKATKLEEETSFMFGPPTIAKPSHELYGDWLLSKGRLKDAQTQYEKALERAPGRRLSVKGLEKARAKNI